MGATFARLCQLKKAGLSLSAVQVLLYVEEHGAAAVGVIADACEVSISSVEKALAAIRRLGLLQQNPAKHDHDHSHGSKKERQQRITARAVKLDDAGDGQAEVDPVAGQLLELEVWPACVEVLMAKVPRAQLEQQLAYHRHRLERGFKFKSHPAKYLYRACLENYAPPADFHQVAHRVREGIAPTSSPTPTAVPVQTPAAQMTREGAWTVFKRGIRSSVPAIKAEAIRLAEVWEFDLAAYA
jgi:DNA-binding MarR family transcriptional regulator